MEDTTAERGSNPLRMNIIVRHSELFRGCEWREGTKCRDYAEGEV